MLASEINTILKTISGIFFDDASEILEVAGTVKATDFIKSDGTVIGGANFENVFENGENVGIGTSTPLKKLDVAGDLQFNYNALIAGFDSSIDSNYDHIWVNDGEQVYGGNAIGNWVFAHDSEYKAPGNSALVAGNVWMRGSTFDNYFAGNVGIGTTSPTSKLEIADSEYVDLKVNQTDSGSIRMGVTSGSAIGFLIAESNMNGVEPQLRFLLKDESQSRGYSEAMRIDSSLNVGIGTTSPSPSAKLEVAGNIRTVGGSLDLNFGDNNRLIVGYDKDIGDWVQFRPENSKGLAFLKGPDSHAMVVTNTGKVGIGNTSPSEKLHVSGKVKATSFVKSSDRTKKQNIKLLENALEIVQNLRGVEFEWKENGKKSIGFVAQEVEEILPELVHGSEGEKSVEYGNLTAILVEAVKAQQAQIEAQNAQIEIQNQSIKNLQIQIGK